MSDAVLISSDFQYAFGSSQVGREHLPRLLFKYRSFDNPMQKAALHKNELFFSSVRNFNDPFDSRGTLTLAEYSEAELLEGFLLSYRLLNKGASEAEALASGHQFIRDKAYQDPRNLTHVFDNYFQDVFDSVGVCSFSAVRDDIVMWGHYANNHRGMCLGFDLGMLHEDVNGTIIRISYSNDLPAINPKGDFLSNYYRLIGTKSLHWSYEQEYRMTKFDNCDAELRYRPQTLKQIVLGCRMPKEQRLAVTRFSRKCLPNVEIYVAQVDSVQYRLVLDRVH